MKRRWFERLGDWLESKGRMLVIQDRESKEPYLKRYYLLFKDRPAWFPFNIVLHNILRSDPDGLHDHPWPYGTLILSGGYYEDTPEGRFWRGPWHFRFKRATSLHRLILNSDYSAPTWTLFIMFRRTRDWGFINESGVWEYWEDFLERRKALK